MQAPALGHGRYTRRAYALLVWGTVGARERLTGLHR